MLLCMLRCLLAGKTWKTKYYDDKNIAILFLFLLTVVVAAKFLSTVSIVNSSHSTRATMPYCSECGTLKTRLNKNKLCRECSVNVGDDNSQGGDDNTIVDETDIAELIQSGEFENPSGYWSNLNKLLDKKFDTFEEKFKATLLNEVKQITEPISKDVKDLKEENKKLKTEVTSLKAKTKEQGEKLEKCEKVLKEHHKTLTRNDKDARAKRLILAGVPEDKATINGAEIENDKDKIKEVMNEIHVLKMMYPGGQVQS